MKDTTKRFIRLSEKELEIRIREGLLKWKNAYEALCATKEYIDTIIRSLENTDNNKGPFNNIPVKRMLILFVASSIALY